MRLLAPSEIEHRETSLLTGSRSLDHLFTISSFPIFMGCVDSPRDQDIFLDLSFSICRETGIVQIDDVPPLALLYQEAHNDAIGNVWRAHHEAFATFASSRARGAVVEIGGGAGGLASRLSKSGAIDHWTMVDPAPTAQEDHKITVIKDVFSEKLRIPGPVRTVLHSHVLEHAFDPVAFMTAIHAVLEDGGTQIFSVPNLFRMFSKGYTNAVNFEHTACLSEEHIDTLLQKIGFVVEKKEYYLDDHSIFYIAKKEGSGQDVPWPNLYGQSVVVAHEFYKRQKLKVERIVRCMSNAHGPIYMFGAHIFSQYLIAMGVDECKVTRLLDNSTLKQGRRLYGTGLRVAAPDVIAADEAPMVILNVAQYRSEIVDQLRRINNRVVIVE